MGVPGNADLLLLKTAAAAGGYQVSRSLRFNSADSAGLSRTFGSAGNRTTWTLSFWTKISSINTSWFLLRVAFGNNDNDHFNIILNTTGTLQISGYNTVWRTTTQVFRDFSAWYHFVIVADTNNGTPDNRLRLYVNGSEITTFSTKNNPSSGATFGVNAAQTHYISEANGYINGYLAEINFVDGSALTPSSFGETDATTGQWIPKLYSGSYGTNGFKLTFADNSAATATALGKDSAGSNNWTPNNFSVTAGAGNDSLKDSPTSISGTDTGVGGEIAGNYCTWNPLNRTANTPIVLKNGNLEVEGTGSASYWSPVNGTIGMSSGKWYWEIKGTGTLYCFIGIAAVLPDDGTAERWPGRTSSSYGYYNNDGRKFNNNTGTSYGAGYDTTDVIGVAFDADNGKLWFAKNGTWQASGNPASGTNAAYSGIAAGTYFPCVSNFYTSAVQETNFGQRAFAYTAPSGFKALVDTNLTAPVIAKSASAFDVKLYTGNGTTNNITGLGFSPDLVWLKKRNAADDHGLFDVVRGVNKWLGSSSVNAEYTYSTAFNSFNSDGFSLGANFGLGNDSGGSFVAWCWDAGTSTVTNTQGSINSQVRANTSAGFSICSWTAPSSGNFTWGHGLGVEPYMVIIKTRASSGYNWRVYHKSIITTVYENIDLNSTGAKFTSGTNMWGAALPTSTVVGSTANNTVGANDASIAYCFAPVAGYSAMSSFVGNGSSEGPFCWCGFRPRFILLKNASYAGADWYIHDTATNTYNVVGNVLRPNTSGAENTYTLMDILSNGFKMRNTFDSHNRNGDTIIWAAFAESPFQYARAR